MYIALCSSFLLSRNVTLYPVRALSECLLLQRSVRHVLVRHGAAPVPPQGQAENHERLDTRAQQQERLRERQLQGNPGAAVAVPGPQQGVYAACEVHV